MISAKKSSLTPWESVEDQEFRSQDVNHKSRLVWSETGANLVSYLCISVSSATVKYWLSSLILKNYRDQYQKNKGGRTSDKSFECDGNKNISGGTINDMESVLLLWWSHEIFTWSITIWYFSQVDQGEHLLLAGVRRLQPWRGGHQEGGVGVQWVQWGHCNIRIIL